MNGDRRSSRVWIETALASASTVLALLTLFVRDWIEVVFRIDPDAGSGAAEWLIVVIWAVAAVAFTLLATRSWRARRGNSGLPLD